MIQAIAVTMYHLNQFPLKIAEGETSILGLERTICIHKEQLSSMDVEIEKAIVLNGDPIVNEQITTL